MSEILSGARYTLGSLVVLTLWSIGAVQFAQWKLESRSEAMAAEAAEYQKSAYDALRRFGPGRE